MKNMIFYGCVSLPECNYIDPTSDSDFFLDRVGTLKVGGTYMHAALHSLKEA